MTLAEETIASYPNGSFLVTVVNEVLGEEIPGKK